MEEGVISKPSFIIIGAGRSGTTSLFHYLAQHKQICMSPVKETNYFAYEENELNAQSDEWEAIDLLFPVKTEKEYFALFDSAGPDCATGEASPLYLYAPGTAERIKRALPDARIVVILRNPVDRAYSNYMGCARDARERRTFDEAIDAEMAGAAGRRLDGIHNYLRAGYYARNLKSYFDQFKRDRIAIFLYEDFVKDPAALLRQLFRFLDVDHAFIPDTSIRYNATGLPRSRFLHHLMSESAAARWVKRHAGNPRGKLLMKCALSLQRGNLKKGKLSSSMRAGLTVLFREDIVELQALIGRDLTRWLD